MKKILSKNWGFKINFLKLFICVFMFSLFGINQTFSQEVFTSEEYVAKSWEQLGMRKWDKVAEYTNACIDKFKKEADQQQASLSALPNENKIKLYQSLNDVATCYFIQAEAEQRQGKVDETIKLCDFIIENYSFAQAWDPRGWYWSVKEKAESMRSKIIPSDDKKSADKPQDTKKIVTRLVLHYSGLNGPIDYEKYGTFENVGTKDYKYKPRNQKGLVEDAGEGVYPNTSAVLKDPAYRQAKKQGRLEGNPWDFIYKNDLEANFYKWATASEPWGVKLFYTALALERAELITQAIKAYYAIVVHYPGATGWTYWQTPWYPGQAAIAKVRFLTRKYPELEFKFEGARIKIINGFDNDITNDIIIANPGILKKMSFIDRLIARFLKKKNQLIDDEPKKIIGTGKVKLVQYKNNHWQLFVNDKPFVIKAVTYAPTLVGQSPDEGTLEDWMMEDTNRNGKLDGPYEAWVDKNRNNKQDEDEPVVGDFQLMKDMGVNAIRIYKQPFVPVKEVLRKMHREYGIYVLLGDFLGKYALGSGASWKEGTDYENPEHKKNMMESVREMVMEFKDEPYILMWLLGNENNYGLACNADKKPAAYFEFVNEVAKMIKSIDKNHPVAVVNGDTLFLDVFAKHCPAVDVFGANAYRGNYGFGSFWEQVNDAVGIPAFISEYGCPAHTDGKTTEEGEQAQADYHKGCWDDIEYNMFLNEGEGNALGGIVFEWLDEWWKAYEPALHDTAGLFTGPFPDGFQKKRDGKRC